MSKRIDKIRWIVQQSLSKKIRIEKEKAKIQKDIGHVEKSIQKLMTDHIKSISSEHLQKIILHTIGECNKKEETATLKEISSMIQKEFYLPVSPDFSKHLKELESAHFVELTPTGYWLTKPVKVKSHIQSVYLPIIKQFEVEKQRLLQNKQKLEKDIEGLDNILETFHITVNKKAPMAQQLLEFLQKNQGRSFSFDDLMQIFPQVPKGTISQTLYYLRKENPAINIDEEKSGRRRYQYCYKEP